MKRSIFSFCILYLFFSVFVYGQNAYVVGPVTDEITVIDTQTDQIVTTISLGNPTTIIVSPDNSTVYVGTEEDLPNPPRVAIIDTATNTITNTIDFTATISFFSINPEGTLVYVSDSMNSFISVVDTTTEMIVSTIPLPGVPRSTVFTPDGTRAYVQVAVAMADDIVAVIDVATEAIIDTIPVGNIAGGVMVITPDGNKIYLANTLAPESVLVISTVSNTVIDTIPFTTDPIGLAVTPDGSLLYVSLPVNDALALINTTTDTQTGDVFFPANTTPTFLAFTSDGFKAYISAISAPSNQVLVLSTTFNIVIDEVFVETPTAIAIQTGAEPPVVSGRSGKNIFLTQTDIFNIISWTAPDFTPQSYEIYRNAALTDLAGCVPASAPLTFEDHNREENTTYTYFIAATRASTGLTLIGSVTVTTP